ncbi:MAG: hypothetical protein WC679_04560 [Bacteroidales bacterium]|jgi:hypothetical protein
MKKNKYFNCPMAIFENYFENPSKCLDNAYDYALWNYAKDIQCETIEEESTVEFLSRFDLNKRSINNSNNKDHICDLIKFYKAEDYFEVKTGNFEKTISNGKKLVEKYNRTKEPFTNISTHIWFDYYKNEKTEWENIMLLAFLGIRSIIGNKSYCKITNLYLFSRMAGFRKSVKSKDELPEILQKYYSEYFKRKIREELEINWHMVTSSGKGYYASFDLGLRELIVRVQKNSIKYKSKLLSKEKKQIKAEVLKDLEEGLY